MIRRTTMCALLALIAFVGYQSVVDHDTREYGTIYGFQEIKTPDYQYSMELLRQAQDGPAKCRNYNDRSFLDRMTDYETGWCKEYLERLENSKTAG